MSRKQKKRNKPYQGTDAAAGQPIVHKYTAVVRSPLGQWWHEHKRVVRVSSLITGGVLAIAYVVFEIIRLVF